MMSKWQWIWKNFTNRLWLRATFFCLMGIATALVALVFKDYIPEDISRKIGAESVDAILHILATSMLAVTTFSLSTLVAAYTAASSAATPRSTRLLLEDRTAQNALSTFIGSFLFSLVGIIALQIGIYGESGRLILLIVTLGVVFVITATLLQWIDHLTQLGRIGKTMEMVESATEKAFAQWKKTPYLGGRPLGDVLPSKEHAIAQPAIGFVQHMDMQRLNELAEEYQTTLSLTCVPGIFCDGQQPLLYSSTVLKLEQQEALQDAYIIGKDRTFDFDPRYGLIVLSEIASRALSPAVNDPGTAIQVIGCGLRLLSGWLNHDDAGIERQYPRLQVRGLVFNDMLNDIYRPIARDGAALVEVGIALQKAYASLACFDQAAFVVRQHSAASLERAMHALAVQADKDILTALAV